MRKFRIHLNGKTYEVAVEEIGEDEGATPSAHNAFQISTARPIPVGANGDEIVVAPMPGKVLRLNVKIGQMVEKGEEILCLEAMKMEHEVLCGRTGTVKEILVSEGAIVNGGDVLVIIG